ncbi:MAG TPA: hypothetical protein VFS91_04250 [Nitrobacter sp.]|nr:hypothetical protein [Nitrobacter sp.]
MAQLIRVEQVERPRQPSIIEIEGIGQIQVGQEFFELSPEQQQQAVNEIRQVYVPPPAPAENIRVTPQERHLPDWLHQAAPLSSGLMGAEQLIHQGVGAVQGAAGVLDNAAELAQGAYNQTLGRLFGPSTSATEANQAGVGFGGAMAPLGQGGQAGRTLGEIGTSALLTRGVGGPVAQGAGTGALLSEAETPGDFIRDVAVGGAGGQLGDWAARGARNFLLPVIEQGARTLYNAGVRLTPGQYLPALREFEDKAMSWPFTGSQIRRSRQQGFQDFARAVPRQALDALRTRLPGRRVAAISDDATGQEAVRTAGNEISAVYENVIPRLNLRADPELEAGFRDVGARLGGEGLSDAGEEQFGRIIRNGVMSRFAGRSASGREYQAADTFLERRIATLGRSEDPDNQIIAEALRDIRAHLRNAIVRQNGRVGRELEAADEAWSMLIPAETAAAGARRGFFSPAQYRSALGRGDSRVRRRGMARGEVRGQEFAEAGGDILPSEFPNYSGTSGHEAYSLGNARFWQGLATRGLYGPTVQGALERVTVGRPQFLDEPARRIADLLRLLPAPQAGAAGAEAVTGPLLGPVPY